MTSILNILVHLVLHTKKFGFQACQTLSGDMSIIYSLSDDILSCKNYSVKFYIYMYIFVEIFLITLLLVEQKKKKVETVLSLFCMPLYIEKLIMIIR